MMETFIDKCIVGIQKKRSPIIVGLDPHIDLLPESIKTRFSSLTQVGNGLFEFNKRIIDAVHDLVPAVKPQIAFYEKYGIPGLKAYQKTIDYAHKKNLLVIGDAKRNDIGSTAEAYASAHIGKVAVNGKSYSPFNSDALTVNAYLGSDGIMPFIENAKMYGKGIFILVKTSNKSSGEVQDLVVEKNNGKQKLYEHVGMLVNQWGNAVMGKNGYSSIGAVVGATYPKEIKELRKIMPRAFFLIPGIGAQGGSVKDVLEAFDEFGLGALINVSRSVIFAYKDNLGYSSNDYDMAARNEVLNLNKEISVVFKNK